MRCDGSHSLDVVHRLNRGISTGIVSEANEAEATATTSIAVLDDDLLKD